MAVERAKWWLTSPFSSTSTKDGEGNKARDQPGAGAGADAVSQDNNHSASSAAYTTSASSPRAAPSTPRSSFLIFKAIYRFLVLAILIVLLALAIVTTMRLSTLLSASGTLLSSLPSLSSASPIIYGPAYGWSARQFQNFVVFGDSYTDENRLNYFGSHNGQAPPPGTILPESYSTTTGGRVWARYVVQYTGHNGPNGTWQPSMNLHNYAVSGAACSNNLTRRTFTPAPENLFPDVLNYELPAFLADVKAGSDPETHARTFPEPLEPWNSVYSIYIGTNDLGDYAFLTDSEVPGTAIPDYVDCVYEVLAQLYKQGARYFVLNNVVPLDLAPQYANATEGGVSKADNLTERAGKMREYTKLVNQVYEYRTPYETILGGRFVGAKFAEFDVYRVFSDIHQNPSQYLNGSAPLNVTSYITATDPASDSPDSFMWHDALHPSEQTDRVLAREFVNVLNGNSSYARYWGF